MSSGAEQTAGALHELHGVRVFLVAETGPPLRSDRDAVGLMGAASDERPEWFALPVARCGDEFFRLRTRILGDVVQKFVNYGLRVAFVGDVSHWVAESDALRDFVREANRGRQLWFVASLEELAQRLARSA